MEKAEKVIVDTEKVLVDAERAADAAADAERAASEVAHGAEEAKGAESGASCALHSFVAGTQILLADGSTKPIEQVANGDVVETTDPSTGAVEQHKVVGTLVHSDEEQRTEITLDSGGALVATDWHPVWVEEAGDWVAIGSLTAGEHLHSADGRSVEVKSVRHFEQAAPVYDLTVDAVHDYYVAADAVSVLVHNCGTADDDLLDFADEALSTPAAARPNVATKVTSADGRHVRFSYATDTRAGGMPSQTSRAVADAGHHGGCGEVGCAAALERDGIPLEGSTFQSVKIGGGGRGNSFPMESHGELIGPCPVSASCP
ncbi:Hint domain-containing protein [Amycolatopsis nalaikhensis]|uniref:Hint domain-containing protein n=1 Tax=Amycolatopsis nalaikhensis TaxID=715472 RepID=A0ABY8XZH9_9PSEU|nr:Hint domain-containing protein [Amycolatopsis sp. 2-2]WIV60946.1 Hint domain-containing protein [Amycolatopsis sp. 2-2]